MQEIEKDASGKILRAIVVDDDRGALFLAQSLLRGFGFSVDAVDNIQDAVENLNKYPYDICFTDINLPIASGLQLTGFIRKRISKDMPVIAITATLPREESHLCFEAGMNGFLEKPTSAELLEKEIRRHLHF